MLPSLSLPPLEFRLGTSPIQAEKSLPDRNAFGAALQMRLSLVEPIGNAISKMEPEESVLLAANGGHDLRS
jgi:hypothetical protein